MKTRFSAPAAAGAGALLCALVLAGCTRPSNPPPAATPDQPDAHALMGGAASRDGRDPLAAARSPSGAGQVQDQAAQDREDDARAKALASDLLAHPDWLARQQALCGPGDGILQARYAALKGPPPPDLRDLKVACLAKDIAEREAPARAAGGVKNTGSL